MDNIYEEMGRGDLACAHPNLYLRMLSSMGVDAAAAERVPVLPAIARINDHLREVVERRHFSVACAVLASAEATIPPSFPALAWGARNAFQDIDLSFFDRHGPRDEGHSGDAATLFALTGDRAQFGSVEREVTLDLEYRSELFDAWAAHLRPETLASRPARADGAQTGGRAVRRVAPLELRQQGLRRRAAAARQRQRGLGRQRVGVVRRRREPAPEVGQAPLRASRGRPAWPAHGSANNPSAPRATGRRPPPGGAAPRPRARSPAP